MYPTKFTRNGVYRNDISIDTLTHTTNDDDAEYPASYGEQINRGFALEIGAQRTDSKSNEVQETKVDSSDTEGSDFEDMLNSIQKDMVKKQMNRAMLKTFDLYNFDGSDHEDDGKNKDLFAEPSDDINREEELAVDAIETKNDSMKIGSALRKSFKRDGARIENALRKSFRKSFRKDGSKLLINRHSSDFEEVKPESIQEKKPIPGPLKKPDPPKKSNSACPCNPCEGLKNSRYTSSRFYRNNPSYIFVFILYILLSIGFVLLQLLVLHVNIPWYVMVARGCAILIYFNTNLIFLTVLRRVTTWFRNSRAGRSLSVIDEFIEFHKFMGVWNFILSWFHSVGQFINLYYYSNLYPGNHETVFDNIKKRSAGPFMDIDLKLFLNNSKTPYIGHFEPLSHNVTQMRVIKDVSLGSYHSLLFWRSSGIGWIGALCAPSGWILLIAYSIMILCASGFVRRKGYFETFYVTHKLYYIYIIAFFIHAPHFWKWFLPIAILLVIERLVNKYRTMKKSFGETYIKDVNLLSSKVTHLAITRPPGFKFQSGDYMFINIPVIAKHEWHPFTISSATELKDEIWVHVRSLGNWTNRLNKYFTDMAVKEENLLRKGYRLAEENARKYGRKPIKPDSKVSQKLSSMVVVTDYGDGRAPTETPLESGDSDINLISNKLSSIYVPILLDGPFGTASGRIFESEHAVLVAGGIGVTPFASILQSLWFQYAASLRSCPKCKHQWYSRYDRKKLKKVDFVWVNRDFEAFEWFVELLAELELQQTQLAKKERFLTIHLYMTSSKVEQEIKCWMDPNNVKDMKKKKLLNELLKEQNKDFSLKLIPGRPKFSQMFKKIQAENHGKVDVYFCGAPRMGQDLMKTSKEFNFNYSQENF